MATVNVVNVFCYKSLSAKDLTTVASAFFAILVWLTSRQRGDSGKSQDNDFHCGSAKTRYYCGVSVESLFGPGRLSVERGFDVRSGSIAIGDPAMGLMTFDLHLPPGRYCCDQGALQKSYGQAQQNDFPRRTIRIRRGCGAGRTLP
jgi:hypothetical protein